MSFFGQPPGVALGAWPQNLQEKDCIVESKQCCPVEFHVSVDTTLHQCVLNSERCVPL